MSEMTIPPLRIGVNTLFHVPGDIGGSETYLREMLLAMVAVYPELRLTLFTSRANDALMRQLFAGKTNVDFCCLPFQARIRPLRIVAEQSLLPLAVWRSGVDVLWSPGYTTPFWAGCPQVVTIHDLQYKTHPEDMSRLEKLTLDCLVRLACRQCRRIIAVSNFSRQEIIRHGFAPAERISAVWEGVDPLFGEVADDPASLAELKVLVPPDRPFLLCVAHTYPHKNVHLLLEAFQQIHERIPHNLVIVGRERLGEGAVAAAANRLSCPERLIRLKDGLPYQALRHLYQRADVFILPSAYEGFGLPVLEAMMAGAPVVTTGMASLAEVAGGHAFLINQLSGPAIAEAIVAALALSAEDKERWCQAAKAWAGTFSWRESAQQTVAILADCAGSGRRGQKPDKRQTSSQG